MNLISAKKQSLELSDGEEIMTLTSFVLTQYRTRVHQSYRLTDGQTDRRTDRHLYRDYTGAYIACYATALVKIDQHLAKLLQNKRVQFYDLQCGYVHCSQDISRSKTTDHNLSFQ